LTQTHLDVAIRADEDGARITLLLFLEIMSQASKSALCMFTLVGPTDVVAVVNKIMVTLWHPLLPYGYSYKASCARPG